MASCALLVKETGTIYVQRIEGVAQIHNYLIAPFSLCLSSHHSCQTFSQKEVLFLFAFRSIFRFPVNFLPGYETRQTSKGLTKEQTLMFVGPHLFYAHLLCLTRLKRFHWLIVQYM